jgi:TRAP-type uncharacterized transport system fused permease subunit
LVIPIIIVIWLLVSGFSPAYAALGAIASAILCSYLKKNTHMSLKDIYDGLAKGARSALTVIAACACSASSSGLSHKPGLG